MDPDKLGKTLIWIRGAGELGSAAAVTLFTAGFKVMLSEISPPLAIRRPVTFSDAILDRRAAIGDIQARLCDPDKIESVNVLPLVLDEPKKILTLKPFIILDARMLKNYKTDFRPWSEFYLGFGPGFNAGMNCHAVLETKRGFDLGRVLWRGSAQADTGKPGEIKGESKRRVLYADCPGKLTWEIEFGDIVTQRQKIGNINGQPVYAPFQGLVRGLIHPAVPMKKGLKIADIDPRGESINFTLISDKASSIARAALETILIFLKTNKEY